MDDDVELALVRQDRLHAGWLADHAQRGFQARMLQILDQSPRAEAADFLVVADEQVHRAHKRPRLKSGTAARQDGDEAFHVAGAAGDRAGRRPGAA